MKLKQYIYFIINKKIKEKNYWKRIYGPIGQYWKALMLSIVFMAGSAVTQPILALIMKPLLDKGFSNENSNYIWTIPLSIIILIFIRGIFNFSSDYLLAWVANRVLHSMRDEMFDCLLRLPDSNFKNGNTGRFLNRFTIDVSNVTGTATEVITVIVRESLIVLALLSVLFYISWILALIVIFMLPTTIFVTQFFIKRLRWINKDTLNMNAELTRVVGESILGQRVIKLFNGYQAEKSRFNFVNGRLRRFAMRAAIADSALAPLTLLCIAFLIAAVIAIALNQATGDTLTIGEFTSFMAALAQIPDPVKRLNNVAGKAQKMIVAAENVFSLMDCPQEKIHGTQVLKQPIRGKVQFHKVRLYFPNSKKCALEDISFTINPGQIVALVGRSGSGKTTLVNVLARFTPTDLGDVLIDDIPIQKLDLHKLRSYVSVVDQNSVFFNDTIAANVAYGMNDKKDEQKIRASLEAADLLEFVNSLPNGINTNVGENASLLSIGQRQRLAIARALIKDAPVLILDEATSALDNESEQEVRSSLKQLSNGRTILIIAHRLSTIKNVDRIFVIDAGKILEQGSHAELIRLNGIYSRLYRKQFKNA